VQAPGNNIAHVSNLEGDVGRWFATAADASLYASALVQTQKIKVFQQRLTC
jgi:hypothetical protein